MITVHMKSGKTYNLNINYPEFNELSQNVKFDRIAVKDAGSQLVHILYKNEIESVEVLWNGTVKELMDTLENKVVH